jgi:alpha/beta superfamily hydrolase
MDQKTTWQKIILIYLSSASMLCLSLVVKSFDADKESRIATQTLQTLFVGEPIWLTSDTKDGRPFLGLVTSEGNKSYTILMIHGTGQGPDTPYVIGPLRELLSETGYGTLSIQMPVLSDDVDYSKYTTEFSEAGKRIQAGIKFLRKTVPNARVVILGHSMGSTMLMDWVGKNGTGNISALIPIGLGSTNQKKSISDVFSSSDINIPILDILGEKDYDSVLWSAPMREKTIKATHKSSTQRTLENADHFFNGHEENVALLIDSWLEKL